MGKNKLWLWYLLPILQLTLGIVGARTGIQPISFTAVGVSCLVPLLMLWNWKEPRFFSNVLLYTTSLTLLFQTTLVSNFLVGTDIHGELFFSWSALQNGWNISLPYEYNTSIFLTVILPGIAKVLGVPLEWVFKVLPPLIFSLVPPIMYRTFKNYWAPRASFLAAFFIIAIPSFLLEVVGIAKEMGAEVFMALALMIVLDKQIKPLTKYYLLPILILLTTTFHYSCGIVLIIFLGGTLVIQGIGKLTKKGVYLLKFKYFLLSVVVGILLSLTFLGTVASGQVVKALYNHAIGQTNILASYAHLTVPLQPIPVEPPEQKPNLAPPYEPEHSGDVESPGVPKQENTGILAMLKNQEPAVQAAIGLDLWKMPPLAKGFRVIQYITQLLVIVGVITILVRWKKYKLPLNRKGESKYGHEVTIELLGLIVTATGLLGLAVLYPGFSAILNASRFYHLASLVLAPCAVTGAIAITAFRKHWPYLMSTILVIYLFFTSGMAFEVTKQESTKDLYLPYCNGLSGYRVDSSGVYSSDDDCVRAFIVLNDIKNVSSDQWGTTFLIERLGSYPSYFPYELEDIPDNQYIFLRARNEEFKEVLYWWGIGMRLRRPYETTGIEKLLEERVLVYQCGNSKLYGPK